MLTIAFLGAALLGVGAAEKTVGLETIRYGKGENIPGYIGGEKGTPAVIVIHEKWGLNEQIQDLAINMSTALGGIRVLIPDLYKGDGSTDREKAHSIMTNQEKPNAVTEISDAAAFLKSEGSPKVGIVGFSMGGALALGALAASKDICCGVTFYGVNFEFFDANDLAEKPVQAHFGQRDIMEGFSDPQTGQKLLNELRGAENEESHAFIYKDCGHSFMNWDPFPFQSFQERKEKMGATFAPYIAAKADLAWDRMISFMSTHVKEVPVPMPEEDPKTGSKKGWKPKTEVPADEDKDEL